MAYWDKGTGAGGIMRITDDGSVVAFQVQAGASQTWGSALPWSGTVNGTGHGGTFAYSTGRPWVTVAAWNVGYTQDVTFNLGATGTSGLGGPTSFTVRINRATAPPAPTPVGIDQIGHTSARYRFSSAGDGGSGILEWQVGYGVLPGTVQHTVASNGTTVLENLSLATTYYVWSRGRNALGWSAWSARSEFTTLSGCLVKVGGVWKQAIPYVKVGGVWMIAIPYVKVGGVWKPTAG